jgi:NAD(P)-dependent dehydrogenase (short-subunit alcohol dehydrogenase family)
MPGNPERLRGRHVVLTGGGTGIGRALARRVGAEGATLTLLARDRDRLERVADELEAAGAARPATAALDVRDRAAVDETIAGAVAERGPLWALLANSGIGGPNEPGPADRFEDLVATNLLGTYWCVRAAEPHVAEEGRIVVTASILARIGVACYTGYCASKAGLLGLVRALAAELAPRRIHVNAVCPGWVDTDMASQGFEARAKELGGTADDAFADAMREVPLRRMSAPDDIAGTVAWLLSDDARNVTGQAIDQNAGAWMG